ncbi:MAG: hypothetical protein WC464_05355 [Bdellovibrionales bacterium]
MPDLENLRWDSTTVDGLLACVVSDMKGVAVRHPDGVKFRVANTTPGGLFTFPQRELVVDVSTNEGALTYTPGKTRELIQQWMTRYFPEENVVIAFRTGRNKEYLNHMPVFSAITVSGVTSENALKILNRIKEKAPSAQTAEAAPSPKS